MLTLVLSRRKLIAYLGAVLMLILAMFALVYGKALWQAFSEGPASHPATLQPVVEVVAPPSANPPAAVSAAVGPVVPAAAVSAQAKTDHNQFFAQFRLERDRVRSQEIDLLKEMIGLTNTTAEARSEAQKRLLELSSRIEKEMELEGLMIAKNYPEAVVMIQPDVTTLVLMSPALSAEQKKALVDLSASIVGCAPEQVTIILRK